MFSVIFEVKRKPDHIDEYLELAKRLKPILEKIDGFIDNERFESKLRKGWLLSHSTWRDEKSVVRWRTQAEHHHVQEQGRSEIFEDYHLRVGEVVNDSDPPPNAAIHEMRFDETVSGKGKFATLTEITPTKDATFAAQAESIPAHLGLDSRAEGLVAYDVFSSINEPNKLALLVAWKDIHAARFWTPKSFEVVQHLRHRIVRVVRDYGMFDRREAPQFYPRVEHA
jgi:heme-degrading monooxygenase HmoA